jgi:hypothetical protein
LLDTLDMKKIMMLRTADTDWLKHLLLAHLANLCKNKLKIYRVDLNNINYYKMFLQHLIFYVLLLNFYYFQSFISFYDIELSLLVSHWRLAVPWPLLFVASTHLACHGTLFFCMISTFNPNWSTRVTAHPTSIYNSKNAMKCHNHSWGTALTFYTTVFHRFQMRFVPYNFNISTCNLLSNCIIN